MSTRRARLHESKVAEQQFLKAYRKQLVKDHSCPSMAVRWLRTYSK